MRDHGRLLIRRLRLKRRPVRKVVINIQLHAVSDLHHYNNSKANKREARRDEVTRKAWRVESDVELEVGGTEELLGGRVV